MSWANRVLPMFMAASGRKTGRLPEPPRNIQIDITLHRFKFSSSSWFPDHGARFNRTLLQRLDYLMSVKKGGHPESTVSSHEPVISSVGGRHFYSYSWLFQSRIHSSRRPSLLPLVSPRKTFYPLG